LLPQLSSTRDIPLPRLSCRVRPATLLDREAVFALVPRLRAFGEVPLRSPEALDAGEQRTLAQHFVAPAEGSRLWVAEGADGVLLGAAYAQSLWDYFTEETHGHLGMLVVARHAARRGVGRALIQEVEAWAREKGFRFLTLNVFARNLDARRFYEHDGFIEDTVRYLKPLS
jgi:GNAT superfamily N-acetyltransferase